MSETITIKIPFNERIERENQNFYFKYVWSKAFNGWKRIIISTLVFLFLGFYPIKNFETNLIFYIFKYGGIFLCGYCFILIYQYFNSKKKYKQQVEELINEFKAKNEYSFIILNGQNIEFKNSFNTVSSIWGKVTYIKINDFIFINVISNFHFIINKSEFKNDDFETILNYLQKYSKQRK